VAAIGVRINHPRAKEAYDFILKQGPGLLNARGGIAMWAFGTESVK
jgi:hypothetical protein